MSLRVEVQNVVCRPQQSPEETVREAMGGDTALALSSTQYVAVGADPAARPQHHAIVSVTGPRASLAAMLGRLVPLEFAVVRQQSTAGVLTITEAAAADDGTGIAYSRGWTNGNVSPSRTGVLFKPNGPLATVKPDYALLLSRLDKP